MTNIVKPSQVMAESSSREPYVYNRASYGGEASKLVLTSLQKMGSSSSPASTHNSRIWSVGKGSMILGCRMYVDRGIK